MNNAVQTFILRWLKTAAKLQLAKSKPLVIGVTGSAGKSSTVQAIGLALQPKYKTYYTKKGNSETGIPFEILGIPVENYRGAAWLKVCVIALVKLITNWQQYEALVVEMGIDSQRPPKNMSYLLSIIQPKVGVFLNVSSVHGENFIGENVIESIAKEKTKLLSSLPANGLAVYSLDHPEILSTLGEVKGQTATFSINNKAEMQLLKHEVGLKGTQFTFSYQDKRHVISFTDQVHFKESFGSFASALLIAEKLGVPLTKSIPVLEKKFKVLPGRMAIIPGVENTTLIDSSYNSSLEATSAALEMLKEIKTEGRRIAVLGDMRELGKQTEADHLALAKVAANNAEIIVLVGALTHKYCWPYLRDNTFPAHNMFSFPHAHVAAAVLPKIIKSGDLILVKGSQNTIFLEIVVKALMLEPEKAYKLLCRQTPYWEEQRQKLIEQPFLTK